jgi:transposase
MKPSVVTDEQRRRAINLVNAGATVRQAAALTGASHSEVTSWVDSAAMQQRKAVRQGVRKGPRKPVYIDGVRLGRLALWT